ncbi:MAG: monooxygenase family protein [Gemmatimonadaceae bacterium]
MAKVIPSRMTAHVEGDFGVFLIGMRINKPWKIHKWLPVFLAMPRMIKELEANRDSGFLGHHGLWSHSSVLALV